MTRDQLLSQLKGLRENILINVRRGHIFSDRQVGQALNGILDLFLESSTELEAASIKKVVLPCKLDRDGYLRTENALQLCDQLVALYESHPATTPPSLAAPASRESAPQAGKLIAGPEPDPRKVFVIHGRDESLRSGIFTFLRSLGLAPLEWTEAVALTGKASPYVGEVLEAAFGHARAVVVLLTPDDEARLRASLSTPEDPPHETQLTAQARPNVLFEAGMALAFQPKRTAIVEIGHLRPFSDVGGRHVIRMDGSVKMRQALAQRLRDAGCPVNLDGTDWHSAGDLSPSGNPAEPEARHSGGQPRVGSPLPQVLR